LKFLPSLVDLVTSSQRHFPEQMQQIREKHKKYSQHAENSNP